MNRKVVALSVVAVALAAVAVHLTYRLNTQPARAPRAEAASREVAASVPAALAQPSPAEASDENTAVAAAAPSNVRKEQAAFLAGEKQEARHLRLSADYLRRTRDPAEQQGLRDRALEFARRTSAGADRRLKLTEAQYERLIQLLADSEMEKRAWNARCLAEPPCVASEEEKARWIAQGKSIHDLIGEQGMRDLKAVRRTEFERRAVDALQARLPAGATLTAAQADDLTQALADERQRLYAAIQQGQQHVMGFSTREGAFLSYADELPTMEQMQQSGEASMQALRDRAALTLSGDQLIAFNRMYDDLSISFRRYLRQRYQTP